MRKIVCLVFFMSILLVTSCDVHQWPVKPDFVKYHLRLNYETDITEWNYLCNETAVVEQGYGETYDNHREYGKIRYIVRTYPILDKQRTTSDYTQEFVFTKDIADGYDHEVTLNLLPGNYNVMVWSDLVPSNGDVYYHDATNFAEIKLLGNHSGSNDYRDAFRGTGEVSVVADIVEYLPDTLDIVMQRPLAKYEFVTNDVADFLDKEAIREASKFNGSNGTSTDDNTTRAVDIEEYKVVFYYIGFMPDTYSLNTDKPIDSSTGVMFTTSLKKLNESEASIGFDYVFVNGKKSAVTVQIGIYNNEGVQVSLTDPIEVPLKRSYHTILKGTFLTMEAAGGVAINPDFEGEHNLIFP